jgi:hypothetical protein
MMNGARSPKTKSPAPVTESAKRPPSAPAAAPSSDNNNNNNNNIKAINAKAAEASQPLEPSHPTLAPIEPLPKPTQSDLALPSKEDTRLVSIEEVDFTKIPSEIEAKLTEFDTTNAVRPTIVNVGTSWQKEFQPSLLSDPLQATLGTAEISRERNASFDLLDALTRSGNLYVEEAELHVIIAATHCFDKTLMNCIIQDNVNPIEHIERSALILASSVHRREAKELVIEEELPRVVAYSAPKLLL